MRERIVLTLLLWATLSTACRAVAILRHSALRGPPTANTAKESHFFTEDSWAIEEMPPYNTSHGAEGFGDRAPCEPQCNWQCGPQRECDEVCEPICAPPKCEMACRKSGDRCETRCEPPRCAVVCPTTRCSSAGECSKCRTVCGAPKCTTVCSDDCTSMCQKPQCMWKCHPGKCPEPQCHMQCTNATCTVDMRSGTGQLPPAMGTDVAAEGFASLDPKILMQPGQAPPTWEIPPRTIIQPAADTSQDANAGDVPHAVKKVLPEVAASAAPPGPPPQQEMRSMVSGAPEQAQDQPLAPIPALKAKWEAEDDRSVESH